MTTHLGSCHCGAIRFAITADPTELTTCDCSLCSKRNAVMAKIPEWSLRLLAGEELLATYQWNSMRAQHHFCSRCGIYVFHRKRAAPDHFGVNVFCLDDYDASRLPIRATEGVGMSVVCDQPRTSWRGPRA